MEDSAGSADKELGIASDSITFKLNALKETWVGVLTDITSRDSFKDIIDGLIKISDAIGGLIKNLGLLGSAATVAGTVLGSKLIKSDKLETLLDAIEQSSINRRDVKAYNREVKQNNQALYDSLFNGDAMRDAKLYSFYDGNKILWGDWKKSIESGQMSSNISDYYEEISSDTEFAKYFQSLLDGNEQLYEGMTLLDGYKLHAKKMYKDLAQENKTIETSFAGLGVSIGNIFKSIGTSIVNGLLSAGIGLAIGFITKLLTMTVDAIKDANDRRTIDAEEAMELADTFDQSFSQLNETIKTNKKTIDGLSEEYVKLSKGVNESGENIGLSADEFKRYHEITKQIGDMMPELIKGYDSEGNYILRLKDNVDALTQAYIDNSLAAADSQWYAKDSEGNSVVEGKLKNSANTLSKTYSFRRFNTDIDEDMRIENNTQQEYITRLEEMANYTEEEFLAIKQDMVDSINDEGWFSIYDTITGLEADDSYAEFIRKVGSQKLKVEREIENAIDGIRDTARLAMADNGNYYGLDEYGQNFVNYAINNLSTDTLQQNGIMDDSYNINEDLLFSYIDDLVSAIKTATPEVQDAYKKLATFNLSEQSIGDSVEQVRQYAELIANEFGMTTEEVLSQYGLDNITKGGNSVKSRLTRQLGVKKAPLVDEFVDALSYEDYKLLLNISIDELSKLHTIDDIKNYIEKVKKENPIELELRTSDQAVDSFADTKAALASLSDIYNQTVENLSGSENGFEFGFANADTINAVESAFKGIADESAVVANALKDFEDTLVRYPNDSEKAQTAINKLVTAWIDESDIIKDLNEENKDWAIQQLKLYGITNAEEVVQSRLNKAYKAGITALSKLKSAMSVYNNALETSEKGSSAYDDALGELRKSLDGILTVYDENGNGIFTTPVDDSFVERHLSDIQAIADGDIDAINRVRTAAAIESIMNITPDIDKGVVYADLSEIANAIIDFCNTNNITIDMALNDENYRSGLAASVAATGASVSDINGMFAQMGYDVEYVPNKYTVTYLKPNANGSKMQWNYGENKMEYFDMVTEQKTVDIPSINVRTKGSGVSSGSTAHYGGGTGTSGGTGGGGNGGGGSSSEPKPEIFDWIEVAIKRAEEAVARLDKVVGNVYDTWGHRNKALAESIGKVVNEYDIVTEAAGAYEKEFDDWIKETGLSSEYVDKIKNGKMEIETIKDETIANNIKEAQTRWDKVVANTDKKLELQITLGDKYKQQFDMVKQEVDARLAIIQDGINYYENKASLAESKGFFINSKIYDEIGKNLDKELAKKEKEWQDLYAKREEAVASGRISKDSEAYLEMTHTLNELEGEIIETQTQIYDNLNTQQEKIREIFDYTMERIDDLKNEENFFIDILGKNSLFNDDGTFNNEGFATAGMHSALYTQNMMAADAYGQKANEALNRFNSTQSKEDLKLYHEYVDLQQQSIQNAYAEKEAMKSLVQEGINKHLEALKELIDKYKESLSEAKNLYDYQKNLEQQTDNIASLEKQLNAYVGDNSEETRATIQKLQDSLDSAKKNLKETQWDKYISETGELLDDLYEDYSDTLNERLDDIDALMTDMIDLSNNHHTEIIETITGVADRVGYTMTESLVKVISNQNIGAEYGSGMSSGGGDAFNQIVGFILGLAGYGSDETNKIMTTLRNDTKGFASGTNYSPYSGLAWTQEKGSEYIFRKSDNALLTPIGQGDMVFTAEMARNLWNLAQSPTLPTIGAKVYKGDGARTINNTNTLSVVLPNVSSYDDFKRQLVNDPKIENFVQEVTIGQLNGNGKLNKRKF